MNYIKTAMERLGFFQEPKVYSLVDGQYGSTGKGLVAARLAEDFAECVDVVTSNAGPNSGHTSYYDGKKIVLKQLPTFSVVAGLLGYRPLTYLNSGAVIDPVVLSEEKNLWSPDLQISDTAAIISEENVQQNKSLVSGIGSTGKGVGPALMHKIGRTTPRAVAKGDDRINEVFLTTPEVATQSMMGQAVFMEVSQGFSLGVNRGFYPYVTSRECTVSQGLADAGLPPSMHHKSIMVVRTFPIRVHGNSGPCYPDQKEIRWGDLGVEPETTTVTKKTRRVFTFSRQQFMDALLANAPDVVVLNFCNYLDQEEVAPFVEQNILRPYYLTMNKNLPLLILGFGPQGDDLVAWEG